MDLWRNESWKSFLLPGGLLFFAALFLLVAKLVSLSASSIDFFFYGSLIAGALLAWRFHSSRVLFSLITLLLAHRAVVFFSAGHSFLSGPGQIAWQAVSFLLPLNFVIFSLSQERGLALPVSAPRLALLFVESVFVAVICRPGKALAPDFLRLPWLDTHWLDWTKVPQIALLGFLVASGLLLMRYFSLHKPTDAGLFWALLAAYMSLRSGAATGAGEPYLATAGLILASCLVQNSYLLAYHDELTGLPSRRGFQEAVNRLEAPYAIAVVDIDHFKSFNDTYGHDTGDQVLRMVAARLARVKGGGQAFRVGGEEFCILFAGKSMKEVVPHLEFLRLDVESAAFRQRARRERRAVNREADRRTASRKSRIARAAMAAGAYHNLSVTVSIGVAEPTTRSGEVQQVIHAADKALYRAKRAGRNRVETASSPRTRTSRMKRSIA